MIDRGELVPYFQIQPPWITTSSQLPDTIMPGERAAHPAPTLVMKDPGRLGSTQYGWFCHSKRPELPAMSKAIVLQCFFSGS